VCSLEEEVVLVGLMVLSALVGDGSVLGILLGLTVKGLDGLAASNLIGDGDEDEID